MDEEMGITATLVTPCNGNRNIVLIKRIGCQWLALLCGNGKEIEVYDDEFVLD